MCLMATFYTLIQLVMRHFGLIVNIIVLFSYELAYFCQRRLFRRRSIEKPGGRLAVDVYSINSIKLLTIC